MGVQDDPALMARIAQLSELFAQAIPATLDGLRQARAGLDPAAPAPEQLLRLCQALHGIAGSAATFGYPTFGQQARRIEHACLALRERTDAGSAEWQAWLENLDVFIAWAAQDAKADYPV